MLRKTIGVIVGFASWSVMWLLGGMGVRLTSPASFDDSSMTTSALLLGTLVALSVVCSVSSGWVAAAIARRRMRGVTLVLGVLLLATGVPVQLSVWHQMPLWYHLTFLGLLIPATVAGGALVRLSRCDARINTTRVLA